MTDPMSNHSLTSISSSPSIFSLGNGPLTEDALAAFQDACIKGTVTPTNGIFSTIPSTGSLSSSYNIPRSFQEPNTKPNVSNAFRSGSLVGTNSTSPNPLRASAGHPSSTNLPTHRRTRSHFTYGEAPVFVFGDDEMDDDSSSEDEYEPLTPVDPCHRIDKFGNEFSQIPLKKHIQSIHPSSQHLQSNEFVFEGSSEINSNLSKTVAPPMSNSPSVPSSQVQSNESPRQNLLGPNAASRDQNQSEANGTSLSPSRSPHQVFRRKKSENFQEISFLTGLEQREAEWRDLATEASNRTTNEITSYTCALSSENISKNRYAAVLAYDCSRVQLSAGKMGSDYINASWLHGADTDKPPMYISAQAPIPDTMDDFWTMIWEQRIGIIVMLTKLVEGGKNKAHKYWPSTQRAYGKIKVTLVHRQLTPYYYRIKQFDVECDDERRTLFQFHFSGWPDQSVPQSPTGLIHLMEDMNDHIALLKAAPYVERLKISTSESYETDSCSTPSTPHSVNDPDAGNGSNDSNSVSFALRNSNFQSNSNSSHNHNNNCSVNSISSNSLGHNGSVTVNASKSMADISILNQHGTSDELTSNRSHSHQQILHPGHTLKVHIQSNNNQSNSSQCPTPCVTQRVGFNALRDASSCISRSSVMPSPSLTSSSSSIYSCFSSGQSTTSGRSHVVTSPSQCSIASLSGLSPSFTSNFIISPDVNSPSPNHPQLGPTLVHCSAGIGRSGAFILVHSVLQKLLAEGKYHNDIDLKSLLQAMRKEREGMITQEAQYKFCDEVIEMALELRRLRRDLPSYNSSNSNNHHDNDLNLNQSEDLSPPPDVRVN